MTPKEALKTLIEDSNLVQEQKDLFLGSLDSLSEEEVVKLGKMLADRRRAEAETSKVAAEQLDKLANAEPPEVE